MCADNIFYRQSNSNIILGSPYYESVADSPHDAVSITHVPSFAEMGYTRFEVVRSSIAAILIGLAPIGLVLLFTR